MKLFIFSLYVLFISATDLYCKNDELIISSLNYYVEKSKNKKRDFYDIFKNPYGKYFEVITVSIANLNCDNIFHKEDSFYEGYLWSICICPKCGKHQGWLFIHDPQYCNLFPSENCNERKPFYGIITDNLKPNEIYYYENIEI
jgi:hypothetical protein